MATTDPFVAPEYVPSPYAFAGLSYKKLPPAAKRYLQKEVGVTAPSKINSTDLEVRYEQLEQNLMRSLEGNNYALVERSHEVRRGSRGSLSMTPSPASPDFTMTQAMDAPPTYQTILENDIRRLSEVLNVILPERQIILDEFLLKWDALFWLEMEGIPEELRFSVETQILTRDTTVKHILTRAQNAPVALDAKLWRAGLRANREIYSGDRAGRDEKLVETLDAYQFPPAEEPTTDA
ncbi:hypothetical protein K474DRAFT_1663409 [Panus rudis PR-1116 ss-1]|nr:hypothetical protein K474DRAFT_1663409 [Panus rudis PR-1116 ss-1]